MSSRATLPGCTAPFRSQPTMFLAPCACSSLMMAVPAAPTPETTIRTCDRDFPVTRSAFRRAAATTIAVPCWSS